MSEKCKCGQEATLVYNGEPMCGSCWYTEHQADMFGQALQHIEDTQEGKPDEKTRQD